MRPNQTLVDNEKGSETDETPRPCDKKVARPSRRASGCVLRRFDYMWRRRTQPDALRLGRATFLSQGRGFSSVSDPFSLSTRVWFGRISQGTRCARKADSVIQRHKSP